jgi:hypothetical protein
MNSMVARPNGTMVTTETSETIFLSEANTGVAAKTNLQKTPFLQKVWHFAPPI